MSHVHAFPCIHSFYSLYFDNILFCCLGLFWLSLSPSLSSVCVSLLLWHPNANLLRLGTLFVTRHPLFLILHHLMSGSVMRRPNWTSLRTFPDKAFIFNTKSSCWTSPTLTFPLSSTVENGSHYVTSRSPVHPCWSRSSTPTCMNLNFKYLSLLLVFKVRALLSHRILYLMCFMSLG